MNKLVHSNNEILFNSTLKKGIVLKYTWRKWERNSNVSAYTHMHKNLKKKKDNNNIRTGVVRLTSNKIKHKWKNTIRNNEGHYNKWNKPIIKR